MLAAFCRQKGWDEIWEGSPAAVYSQISPRVALAVGAQMQRPGPREAALRIRQHLQLQDCGLEAWRRAWAATEDQVCVCV